jgi:homoserine kinase type II
MATTVWVVWHIDDDAAYRSDENEKLIGVYSSEQLANDAIERLGNKPGFRDFRERWRVDEYLLDKDGMWADGFVTVPKGSVP